MDNGSGFYRITFSELENRTQERGSPLEFEDNTDNK